MRLLNGTKFDRPPRCVLLDLDNTLYSYEPCNDAGTDAARKMAGLLLSVASGEFDRCFDAARREVKAVLGSTAASHSRLLYFQRTLEIAGFASQPSVSLQLEQTFWCAYLDQAELFVGVVEFLDDLRHANIPDIVVTDLTAQIQMRKLVAFGLDKHVDWIMTSEEIGADKPNPMMFQRALGKIEVEGGPIWMIGDNLDTDMAGAGAAVSAVRIQKIHAGIVAARSADQADATFEHFGDLNDLLKKVLSASV